jgi:predicted metal-binding transcription factor (methanogenesis marker protein 9)
MKTTRKQRQDFIKQMKKNNPFMSKEELIDLKKQMADLGREQHEKLQEEVKIIKSLDIVTERKKRVELGKQVDIDLELENIKEDDFIPEDL